MAGRINQALISDSSSLFSSAAAHRLRSPVLGHCRWKVWSGPSLFWTDVLISGHSFTSRFSPALFGGLLVFHLEMLAGLEGQAFQRPVYMRGRTHSKEKED